MTSAIALYSDTIFYTSAIGQCFWCSAPCCRVDVCYEGYVCRDCESEVEADLRRLEQQFFIKLVP